MTAPRGGGDEPSSSSAAAASSMANDPVTPTSMLMSGQQGGLNRRGSRGAAMATFSMEVFDNEVVPPTLNSIAPILRVAAEIEPERPRVAYLCTFHSASIFYTFFRWNFWCVLGTGWRIWCFERNKQLVMVFFFGV